MLTGSSQLSVYPPWSASYQPSKPCSTEHVQTPYHCPHVLLTSYHQETTLQDTLFGFYTPLQFSIITYRPLSLLHRGPAYPHCPSAPLD